MGSCSVSQLLTCPAWDALPQGLLAPPSSLRHPGLPLTLTSSRKSSLRDCSSDIVLPSALPHTWVRGSPTDPLPYNRKLHWSQDSESLAHTVSPGASGWPRLQGSSQHAPPPQMGWQGHSSFTYWGLGGGLLHPNLVFPPLLHPQHQPRSPRPWNPCCWEKHPSQWAWNRSLHCWCSTGLLPPAPHPRYKQVLVASQLPRPGAPGLWHPMCGNHWDPSAPVAVSPPIASRWGSPYPSELGLWVHVHPKVTRI